MRGLDLFLRHARDGQFVGQRCTGCETTHLPPVMRCGTCGGTVFDWEELSGRGSVASFTRLHRAPSDVHRQRIPYAYAVVHLDEGPYVVSNIVHVGTEQMAVGQRVSVVFEREDEDGQVWPDFAPER